MSPNVCWLFLRALSCFNASSNGEHNIASHLTSTMTFSNFVPAASHLHALTYTTVIATLGSTSASAVTSPDPSFNRRRVDSYSLDRDRLSRHPVFAPPLSEYVFGWLPDRRRAPDQLLANTSLGIQWEFDICRRHDKTTNEDGGYPPDSHTHALTGVAISGCRCHGYVPQLKAERKPSVALGLTVILAAQSPTVLLNTLNVLKFTEALNSPRSNRKSTASLLRIRKLVGSAVRAYEPRNPNSAVGIIRDVDASISEEVLLRNLSANMSKITQVRRFANTETVRVPFAPATLREHVFLGRVRHKVELYADRPMQCRKCGKFGHVNAVWTRPEVCTRCSGSHASERCEAERANCCDQHSIEQDNGIVLQNRFSDLYDETQDLLLERSNVPQNEQRSSHPARRVSSTPGSASREQVVSREQHAEPLTTT
ncbi:hypothetical protein HPB47_027113 [Ixodes persulcatus]|uniref:Uncharacterized protein n=1 Tax=Ixodes persulcatus TaxID=34615 RepID=A0AC60PY01_IXOPE|nr:hypothetical protein HPB47_027113 [Ixodes persulcatus]